MNIKIVTALALVIILMIMMAVPVFADGDWNIDDQEGNKIVATYDFGLPHLPNAWVPKLDGSQPEGSSWGIQHPSTGIFKWTPALNQAGTYNFTLRYDDHHSYNTISVHLVVNNLETTGSDLAPLYTITSTLDIRLDAAESDIDDIQGMIGDYGANIDALNEAMTTSQSDIATLQEEMVQAQTEIADLQSRMSNAEEDIDVLQQQMLCVRWQLAVINQHMHWGECYLQQIQAQSLFRDRLLTIWNIWQECHLQGLDKSVAEINDQIDLIWIAINKLQPQVVAYAYPVVSNEIQQQLQEQIDVLTASIAALNAQLLQQLQSQNDSIAALNTQLLQTLQDGDKVVQEQIMQQSIIMNQQFASITEQLTAVTDQYNALLGQLLAGDEFNAQRLSEAYAALTQLLDNVQSEVAKNNEQDLALRNSMTAADNNLQKEMGQQELASISSDNDLRMSSAAEDSDINNKVNKIILTLVVVYTAIVGSMVYLAIKKTFF